MLIVAAAVAGAAVVVKQSLTATSKAPNAKGHAMLRLKTSANGKFTVVGRRLRANGKFDVVVRGVNVGTLTTNAHGAGKAKFGTGARGHHQLLGFDPRGAQVIVRDDENGDDDLVGDMPDGDDSAAGAFPCCVKDEDGDNALECEELTPTDCTNAGGTPNQAASCLPDPCVTPPAPGTVCCVSESAEGAFVDEDAEVECDEDASDCAEEGGTVITATSCEPNPCTPTPPPTLVACCVPDEDETECRMLTPETCSAKGTPSGTSCASASCAGHEGEDGDDHGENSGHDGGGGDD
jgi:hypothetical protein